MTRTMPSTGDEDHPESSRKPVPDPFGPSLAGGPRQEPGQEAGRPQTPHHYSGSHITPDFRAPVAQAIMAESIENIELTVYADYARRSASAAVLDAEFVSHQRKIYVRVPGWEGAWETLRRRRAVALVGAPGRGREITAVNLLAESGVVPRRLILDPDNPSDDISVRKGSGYLVDLSVLLNSSSAVVHSAVDRCLQILDDPACRVVFLADEQIAQRACLRDRELARTIRPAPAGPVFVKELMHLSAERDVEIWAKHPRIDAILSEALPADAARLAHLIHEIHTDPSHQLPTDQQIDEVTGAYTNWHKELQAWDKTVSGTSTPHCPSLPAEQRALILAAAVLEGCSPRIVLSAMDVLLEVCGIAPGSGSGLAGPPLSQRLHGIGAVVENDRVRFRRKAYGPAVLDWAWEERPAIRRAMPSWMAAVGPDLPSEQGAGLALLELARRKADPELVADVAFAWRGRAVTRAVAAHMLGAAALTAELGGPVRKKLYAWARSGSDPDAHLLVAEVCRGEMAQGFPEVTLTRLRNLACHDGDAVRRAVVRAVVELHSHPQLRPVLLRETVRWAASGHQAQAETGCWAFLELMELRDPTGDRIYPGHKPSVDELSLLGAGWRVCLRSERTRQQAEGLVFALCDSVSKAQQFHGDALLPLAYACRSSIDVASMMGLLTRWFSMTETPVTHAEQLLQYAEGLLVEQERLTPAASPGAPSSFSGETS